MSTKIKIIMGVLLISIIVAGIALNYPDWRSFRTRLFAVSIEFSHGQLDLDTIRFVETVEGIRSKWELRFEPLAVEQASQRESEVKALVGAGRSPEQLQSLLRVYRDSMYLDTEKTGTYQVVFFAVVRAYHRDYNVDGAHTADLLRLKDELSLADTDSGEFQAIVENRPFP